jgi:FixJ family two-component response regulator
MPIIFITGYGDVPMTVRAMKAGAAEFLTKPFKDQVLLTAIDAAIERSRVALDRESELRALHEPHRLLTSREGKVMAPGVAGRLNKQVAGQLGITREYGESTPMVMREMGADSLADFVTMAARLRAGAPQSGQSR